MNTYTVTVYDQCGKLETAKFDSFEEALAFFRGWDQHLLEMHSAAVRMFGPDADSEGDGLSSEQRDALYE
jgi:hypothetical protein